jgi:hypothetical protein
MRTQAVHMSEVLTLALLLLAMGPKAASEKYRSCPSQEGRGYSHARPSSPLSVNITP